jgi:hypothetical protein
MFRSALLAGCIALVAASSKADVLAPLPARTLSGRNVVVPRDLPSTSVVVVGFAKSARKETEASAKRLRDDRQLAQHAVVYDVIVLDGVPGFIRSTIIKQLVSGIPKDRHDRFLVVTEAAGKWKRFLGATDEDRAYVALIAKGEVVWTGRGAVTDAAHQQIRTRAAATVTRN